MKRRTRRKWLGAAAIDAAVSYFFDPQMGKSRRTMARDRLGGMLRRTARRTGLWGRWAGVSGCGRGMKVTHPVEQPKDVDDATLAHKVESVVLRGPSVPEGISVNA